MNFLFEDASWNDDTEKFVKAAESLQLNYKLIKWLSSEYPAVDGPAYFFGSLGLARSIQQKGIYDPGPVDDFSKFKCSYYYYYFQKFLWNYKHVYFPYGQIYNNPIPYDTMCLVAPTKTPLNEYRFFINHNEIVTGSQYRKDYRLSLSPHIPDRVTAFVNFVIRETAGWYSNKLYVLDIAEAYDGELGVLEVNSWSCSGIYAANAVEILKATINYDS